MLQNGPSSDRTAGPVIHRPTWGNEERDDVGDVLGLAGSAQCRQPSAVGPVQSAQM